MNCASYHAVNESATVLNNCAKSPLYSGLYRVLAASTVFGNNFTKWLRYNVMRG
jgi:hypothetical protein